MQVHEHTAELGGERSLHMRQRGSGEDIVLVHGALTTGCDWSGPLVERLAGLGRVTIIDRPGHGRSSRPRGEASPRRHAAQVRDALRCVGVERPLLVGHSLGAMLALAYAEQFPAEVSSLVLISPLAFPELRPLEQTIFGPRALPVFGPAISTFMNAGPDRPILQAIHQQMFAPDQPPQHWREHYPWWWMLSREAGVATGEEVALVSSFGPQATLDVQRIAANTSVLAGGKDAIVRPAAQANALARMLPNARLTTIPDGGHMLHHTHPAHVVSEVERSLEPVAGV
jgi:pimeloyl-ACP methyl ester carboxylesterase